jgi:hypothetical protein
MPAMAPVLRLDEDDDVPLELPEPPLVFMPSKLLVMVLAWSVSSTWLVWTHENQRSVGNPGST